MTELVIFHDNHFQQVRMSFRSAYLSQQEHFGYIVDLKATTSAWSNTVYVHFCKLCLENFQGKIHQRKLFLDPSRSTHQAHVSSINNEYGNLFFHQKLKKVSIVLKEEVIAVPLNHA